MAKFVPRQRKHKVLARQKSSQHGDASTTQVDANATELVPPTPSEREARRAALHDELRAQQSHSQFQPKVSSKKKKRLEKYIDTKLKKEENLELIKKLAAHKVDTSLLFSSKKLGRGGESARERLERALREKEAGVNVKENDAVLFESRKRPARSQAFDDASDDDDDDDDDNDNEDEDKAVSKPPPHAPSAGLFGNGGAGLFGSGLKRPLDVDDAGNPIIKKRKRRKITKAPVAPKQPEWDGFSSDGEDEEDDEEDDEEEEEDDDFSDDQEDGMEDDSEEEPVNQDELEDDDEDDEQDSDAESSSSDASASSSSSAPATKARSSAFKAWATQQRNQSLGFTPSTVIDSENLHPAKPANFVPRAPSPEALPAELLVPTTSAPSDNRPAVSVVVPRTPEIQQGRLKLPVVQEEQKIMEAIHHQDVIVVWGATGSGKTTQVPQMMFESGYGSKIGEPATAEEAAKSDRTRGIIGVTQPRRVAAVSVAERVGTELCAMKDRVGYQIRFDTTVSKNTAIKFMTDGILLREIANDFILSRYSAIVIDEAHERSVNTDILIGMMSRIVDLRAQMAREDPEKYYPLKLVIMSATLRIEDFTKNQRLFRQGPPPIVQAEGRQFPVTVHFARRTQRDYIDDMFHKVTRGHKKLPPGGMLVFLTGQNEITALAKRLRQAFPSDTGAQVKQPRMHVSAQDAPLEVEDMDASNAAPYGGRDDFGDDDSDAEIHGLDDEDDQDFVIDGEEAATSLKVHVLPLYSQLPTKQQLRVFEEPPEGSRLIVLATNVAETSLTIPNIRYVFDCGRSKEKKYEPSTGVQTFEIGWISKASASQRSGRAGRTGPGHCYRLYSSAVYERDFEEYAIPEILRSPIEGVVLSLKNMDIQTIVNFPFPTPPDRQALAKAEKLLTYLGAIDARGKITDAGKELAAYPLSPRFARMLLLAQRYNISAHTTALVASLAVPELFIPQNQYNADAQTDKDSDSDSDSDVERPMRTEADNLAATEAERKRKAYNKAHATLSRWDDKSDALKLLTTFAVYTSSKSPSTFCEEYFVREKAMKEAAQLRHQLTAIVRSQSRIADAATAAAAGDKIPPPNEKQRSILKQLVAAGFIDQVAIRADLLKDDPTPLYGRKPRRAAEVPYRTLFASHDHHLARDTDPEARENAKLVYIHPSSVLAHLSVKEMPDYVIYSHLSRSTASTIEGSKVPRTRMHPLTSASAKVLANLADGTPLLEIGKPIGKIEALERGAEDGRERRMCWVGLTLRGDVESGSGWPVGARKVVQKRVGGVWETEKVVG